MATTNTSTAGQPDNYGIGAAGTKVNDYVSLGNGSANQSGTGTSSSSGSTSGSGIQTQTTNSNSTTRNLDDATMNLLKQIIQQLASGGTPEMRREQAVRNNEIATVQGNRAGYSKDAAFADSQGLIAQQTRRVLEQLMPNINRAAEDAGSSGGALRALLLQDAGNKAAESASALGVNAAASYGSVNANFSQILEALTRVDSSSVNALAQLANTLKGGLSTTTGTSTTVGTNNTQSNTNQTGNTTQNQTNRTTDNKMVDFAPFQPLTLSTFNNGNQPQIYFGPGGGGDTQQLSNDILSKLSTDRAFSEFRF